MGFQNTPLFRPDVHNSVLSLLSPQYNTMQPFMSILHPCSIHMPCWYRQSACVHHCCAKQPFQSLRGMWECYQQVERWCWTSWVSPAAWSLPCNALHPSRRGELGVPSGADWKVSSWHRFEKVWCAVSWLINFYLKIFSHLNLHGCRQQMGRWRRRRSEREHRCTLSCH